MSSARTYPKKALPLSKRIKYLKNMPSNGIYYFLGSVPQHVTHVLPLYELIGGTVMVTSKAALEFLGAYPVKSILVDDEPEVFLDLDIRVQKSIQHLNDDAQVVFVYETFTFKGVKIDIPTIMLSHGIPLKDYWVDWKIKTVIENYTYIATLGDFMKDQLLERGVPESKFLDFGLTRNDLIINSQSKYSKKEFFGLLPNYKGQPIISYMPTYWGASSVFDTGLEIIKNISDKYYVVFKPHPQTPWETTKKYIEVIEQRGNLHFQPEAEVDLLSLYKYSKLIIGDMSSVVADAILADKPIILAYGGDENKQDKDLYKPIKEVQVTSFSVYPGQEDCIDLIIDAALNNIHPRKSTYKVVKERLFHNLDGKSRLDVARFVLDTVLQ